MAKVHTYAGHEHLCEPDASGASLAAWDNRD